MAETQREGARLCVKVHIHIALLPRIRTRLQVKRSQQRIVLAMSLIRRSACPYARH